MQSDSKSRSAGPRPVMLVVFIVLILIIGALFMKQRALEREAQERVAEITLLLSSAVDSLAASEDGGLAGENPVDEHPGLSKTYAGEDRAALLERLRQFNLCRTMSTACPTLAEESATA